MSYSLEIVTPPSERSVTVEELHQAATINVVVSAVEAMLERFIATAESQFCFYSNGRVVSETVFDQFSPCWPRACKPLQLQRAKVTEVESVKYYDEDDVLQTLDPELYEVDTTGVPALVWLKDGTVWPTLSRNRPRPVVVRFTAGWGYDSVPEDVRTGVLVLGVHYWIHRGDTETDIPQSFIRLANQYHTGLVTV